ncbi:YybH family protein [Pontimicrobium aquaticum]|uniref:DUF4440 domain-containing protein n=1 Tax=Pontimicrobium aquaticum TaxID=2565367 RepID=A0A4U0EYQ9_9FLAO|nr:hypothetical protein [Pontimicrobium aquaticum]TJY37080.1 hypothetical protein E5167_03800 [Pontimicrobium aquaticum]
MKNYIKNKNHLTVILILILFITNSCNTSNTKIEELSENDLKDIEQLENDYVRAWFDDDQQNAVLNVFEDNVAFIPHHGDKPVVGIENLRNFFWPDGIGGIVNSFNHYPDKIEGNNQVAWVRGRFDIKYSWIIDKDTTTTVNEGNYVFVARKREDNQWKIATFIFNDPVAQIKN